MARNPHTRLGVTHSGGGLERVPAPVSMLWLACPCAAGHLICPVAGLRPRRGIQTDANTTHTHAGGALLWGRGGALPAAQCRGCPGAPRGHFNRSAEAGPSWRVRRVAWTCFVRRNIKIGNRLSKGISGGQAKVRSRAHAVWESLPRRRICRALPPSGATLRAELCISWSHRQQTDLRAARACQAPPHGAQA